MADCFMVKVCTGIPLPVLTLINADASRRTISTRISTSYRGGFTPALRAALFKRFEGLETKTCPFKNLPEARRGPWGEGLTAAETEKCRWLKPI